MKALFSPFFIVISVLILCTPVEAQLYEELYSFSNQPGGYTPYAGLVEGNDGCFYGTTENGGVWDEGTVFKISKAGAMTIIASLGSNTVAYPTETFILASDDNFYGNDLRLTPDGILTVGDWGGIEATNGFLYAYNPGDGTSTDCGAIFRVSLNGQTNELMHQFTWDRYTQDGVFPEGDPIPARDGYLYGTTSEGGTNGWGTVYRMTYDGQLTTIASFAGTNGGGAFPYGPLLQASDGNFYGTSEWGDWGQGEIFKVTPAGVLTTFHSFDYTDGENPNPGLIEGNDGNIYGTTSEGGFNEDLGTVFQLRPDGTAIALVTFTGVNGACPGANPYYGMVQGSDGNLYGTSGTEGTQGGGNVFRIIMPGPQLNITQAAGQLVLSWRTNYTGFTLQTCDQLDFANWTDCSNSPTASGGQFVLTNAISDGNQFFRLSK